MRLVSTQVRKSLYPALKRGFDLLGAGIGLALLWPAALLIAFLIKLSDPGPVFFTQTRVGRFGRPFHIWKFRTMVVDAERSGLPLTTGTDVRITRIGRFLRRTKIDELPQLWNVLKGEMSLVGPRPEVPRYVEHYTTRQREILAYKPGMTDLASLFFRNEEGLLRGIDDVEQLYLSCCLPKKIQLNQQYAAEAGVLKDAWIVLRTICPYWLGVALLYGILLTASFWLALLLQHDFHLAADHYDLFLRNVLWLLLPQLAALGAMSQLRGLVSYFSLLELRRTFVALGLALTGHLILWKCSDGALLPAPSTLLLDALIAWALLCSLRMVCQFFRQHRAASKGSDRSPPRRVAIIGAGQGGTRLALDLAENRDNTRQVVAFFDDDPRRWHQRPHDIPIVGMPECLLNPEWRDNLDEVLVACSELDATRLEQLWTLLNRSPLRITFASA